MIPMIVEMELGRLHCKPAAFRFWLCCLQLVIWVVPRQAPHKANYDGETPLLCAVQKGRRWPQGQRINENEGQY